jgi:hypothetical protein
MKRLAKSPNASAPRCLAITPNTIPATPSMKSAKSVPMGPKKNGGMVGAAIPSAIPTDASQTPFFLCRTLGSTVTNARGAEGVRDGVLAVFCSDDSLVSSVFMVLETCARTRTRTWDHRGISSALYQLSYARMPTTIP